MKFFYACIIICCYSTFCWYCWYRYRQQYAIDAVLPKEVDALVVAYASQSGQAAALAQNTVRQLGEGRVEAKVLPLDRLDDTLLQRSGKILFVVSTYGEGDPPDMAARFARRYLSPGQRDLSHLRYGILALGDRQYQNFCGFGHRLCQGLQNQAARPLFDLIEVDRQDPDALSQWQQRVVGLGGARVAPARLMPTDVSTRLVQRSCLNPGSEGAPVYQLGLNPDQPIHWQAGDIACITPGNAPEDVQEFIHSLKRDGEGFVDTAEGPARLEQILTYRRLPKQLQELAQLDLPDLLQQLPPLPNRDYSIASIPEDGQIELLVRQICDADGNLGLGSGWLTQHALLFGAVRVNIRSNPAFHAPDPAMPLILIGNGTGMAGLRAHLRARVQCGANDNWLLFGERNSAHDFHFGEDVVGWQRRGHLQRLDVVYSRDGGRYRYVQELVAANGHALRSWLDRGAAIYICGGLEGMAAGVEAALINLLTERGLAKLLEQGRYRRDVY